MHIIRMLQNHMTEKSLKKGYRNLQTIASCSAQSTPPKRGRPKGAKNKPKSPPNQEVKIVSAHLPRRGRPKGSKNKPKQSPSSEVVTVKMKRASKHETESVSAAPKKRGRPPKAQQTEQPSELEEHPLLVAVKWLEKYMHHSELQYYRNRANKIGVSLHVAMSSDILGFFNVQNPEICKQIKKNNFIANNHSYDLHQ